MTRPGKFFDVRPTHPDPQWLLDRLAEGSDAEIGVLPELCLARPDELEESISADHGAYPPLIVAGSAHVREGSGASEVRANESRVYLDGEQVAAHRKIHQFKTKRLDGKTYADPQQEDLSPEPKSITVLSGTHTRLAVLICADLLDEKVPGRLVSAWVNLLLAPAMTRKPGSFETTVEDVSGRCQGVSAVANARLATSGKPFLCMLGNPRATRSQRFACLDGSAVTPPPGLALYDSADALPASVQWR
jgi:predicted amidohydrolase